MLYFILNTDNNLANLIRLVHYTLVVFVFIAHSLLPLVYVKYYLLLIILIFIGWNDLSGQCILTRLEHYFRTGEWNQKAPTEGGPEFLRPVLNEMFDINISRVQAERLSSFLLIALWLVAFMRIYHLL
jgi:hypothetical protein